MDLKSKSRAWVGNIYQRFETMCHEVDSIVNQDAVKYVESHVQTVGESVKKICSDVVQIVDPVRYEAQAVALKGNAVVGTYIKSIIGTKENNGHTVPTGQSYFEPSDLSERNAVDGFNFVHQTTVLTPHESHQGPEFDMARNIDDVSMDENHDLSMEENARQKSSAPDALDLIASLENDSTSAVLSHEVTDDINEFACVSEDKDAASTSVNGQDSQPSQDVEIVYFNSADVPDFVPDISTAVGLSETTSSFGSSCGSTFTEPCTLPGHSLNDILENIEPCADVFNVAAHVSEHSSLLNSSASAPILSSNNEEEETGLTFSNSVLSMESTDRLISLSSPASTPIDFCNKGEDEIRPGCSNSVMSLEATECSGCSTYVVDGVADCGMETIDLLDKVKLEESCVIVDNSMLYEVVRRIHRQRSYKKKIQDAFNTRKRLNKEYEQLAIWYGDLDTESSQDTVQRALPFSNTVTLDPDIQVQYSQDSEWELL